jgi:hypothetical protein
MTFVNRLLAMGALLFAISLPLHADTISTFSFSNAALIGVSNGAVSGSFTFNATTHTMSAAGISFNGNPAFANLNVSFGSQTGNQYTALYQFSTTVYNPNTGKTDTVAFSVLVNIFNGQVLGVGGQIYDPTGQGGFFYTDQVNVPEAGPWFGFVLPSGLAMLGGLFLAGKRNHALRVS